MSNETETNEVAAARETRSRPRPLLWFGAVMWVCCFVGIGFCWYQWRQQNLQRRAEQAAVPSTDNPEQKQISLVLQKDGSYVAQEVGQADQSTAWDEAGIDNFSLTDTEGHTVHKSDLSGKPFVIAFVFTHCRGPCPNVTLQMRGLQDQLKDYDFNLVTLTVDPERDTMETLEGYGRENGADFSRWKFLTGDQTEIYGLIQHSFKMPVEETKGESRVPGFEIIHSTNIMLVDATGRVIGKYNAQKDDEMGKLRKDLKRIAKHKSGENEATIRGEN